MEQEHYKHPENFATNLMKNDYLNTYLPFFELRTRGLEYIESRRPKGFSARYPNMTYNNYPFNTTDEEWQRIQELDRLSAEVNHLIDSQDMEIGSILEIGIKVAEICGRADLADKLRLEIQMLGKTNASPKSEN